MGWRAALHPNGWRQRQAVADALDDLDESSDDDDEEMRPLGVIAREMLAQEEEDWEDDSYTHQHIEMEDREDESD